MGTRRVAFLDVFAERPLAGNGLAVVEDADALGDEVMQAFAVETKLSETTFVQTASTDGADYRNRIFTVTREVPFAGHPSLGTAVAVARWRGDEEATYVQQTGAGLQPIEVRRDGQRWFASVLQEPAEFGGEHDPDEFLAAVGLESGDAHPALPVQLVSTGLPAVVVPVRREEDVSRAQPDLQRVEAAMGGEDWNFYLCWSDPETGRVRARMFNQFIVGGEDPATGSAAGPLCAYLAERLGLERIEIVQGEEMGRPSSLVAELEGDRVRVGGGVVPLIDGTVELPG